MSLFDDILAESRKESAHWQKKKSLKKLKKEVRNLPSTKNFAGCLLDGEYGLIAEIKKCSPSKGLMATNIEGRISEAIETYEKHPTVKAVSVVTQESHFGGNITLFKNVRNRIRKPILRKGFFENEHDIYHSRVLGADAILLMACVIKDKSKFTDLHNLATSLGLHVLCEVHNIDELSYVPENVRIIGINSRDFAAPDFEKRAKKTSKMGRYGAKIRSDKSTELGAFDLISELRENVIKIAESGISPDNINEVLEKYKFDSFLIGTSILQSPQPIIYQLNDFEEKLTDWRVKERADRMQKILVA